MKASPTGRSSHLLRRAWEKHTEGIYTLMRRRKWRLLLTARYALLLTSLVCARNAFFSKRLRV